MIRTRFIAAALGAAAWLVFFWLTCAFVTWDAAWFSGIGEWEEATRFVFFIWAFPPAAGFAFIGYSVPE